MAPQNSSSANMCDCPAGNNDGAESKPASKERSSPKSTAAVLQSSTQSPKKDCGCRSNCSCCKASKEPQTKKYCKYVQPERSKSYRPVRGYAPPTSKMDNKSVYRCAFLPGLAERSEQFKPKNNITAETGKMSGDTVNKMSYKEYKNAVPATPVVPCRHNLLGAGPLQNVTTHRHDYVRKPIDVPMSFKPIARSTSSDAPLSDKTINRLSYQPIDLRQAKTQAFRPVAEFKQFGGTMDCNTVHRLSFQPYEPQEPVDKPWARKQVYAKPELVMSGSTVYTRSYIPMVDFEKSQSFKPKNAYSAPSVKLEKETVYKRSYVPNNGERAEKFPPRPSTVMMGEGKFCGKTAYNTSYLPYENAVPAVPIVPCRRKYNDGGPMQDLTTHKHDYVIKPITKQQSFKPVQKTNESEEPLSDKTINRLSYVAYDMNKTRVQPFRLRDNIEKPTGKIAGETVHNLSYVPKKPQTPREKPSWAEREKFVPPELPMNGNTIHSLSYQLPGAYIECSSSDPNCIPCPETPCKEEAKPCCTSCCCGQA